MIEHEETITMNNKVFAANLTRLRTTRSMTQEQLAERLGVSRQSVSKWESGICLPELATLDTLCGLFGVTLDDLLRGSVVDRDEAALAAYDSEYNRFAAVVSAGIAAILAGVTASAALSAAGRSEQMMALALFLGVIVGTVLLVTGGIQHDAFEKRHPCADVFYPDAQIEAYERIFPWLMAGPIALILSGLVLAYFFTGTKGELFAGALFMAIVTVAVAILAWGGIQKAKYEDPEQARRKHDDPGFANRQNLIGKLCGVLWILAVLGYLLWGFLADGWGKGWVLFVAAALLSGVIGVVFSREGDD